MYRRFFHNGLGRPVPQSNLDQIECGLTFAAIVATGFPGVCVPAWPKSPAAFSSRFAGLGFG
jgi:hypothetical protein